MREQAEELADVTAEEGTDERVEWASPTRIEIPTRGGDVPAIVHGASRAQEPPVDRDARRVRASDEQEPETAGHSPSDLDIEGNWEQD